MYWPRPIPIEDRLPENGVAVLAYDLNHGWWQANYFNDDGQNEWWLVGLADDPIQPKVTHWVPMPNEAPRLL